MLVAGVSMTAITIQHYSTNLFHASREPPKKTLRSDTPYEEREHGKAVGHKTQFYEYKMSNNIII